MTKSGAQNENLYIKPTAQVELERFIMSDEVFITLRNFGLVGKMYNIDSQYKDELLENNDVHCLCQKSIHAHDISKTMKKFRELVSNAIWNILHEKKVHALIEEFVQNFGGWYDTETHEYDRLFEIVSETYVDLSKVISKDKNKGRIRVDAFLDRPDYTYDYIREYIISNKIKDEARKRNNKVQRETPYYITNEDGDEVTIVETGGCRNALGNDYGYSMEDYHSNYETIAVWANKYRRKPLYFITWLLIFTDPEEPHPRDIENILKNYKSFKGFLTDHLSSLPACEDQSIIPEELFSLAQTNWNNYSNKTGKGLDYYKNRVKSDMEEWVKKR